MTNMQSSALGASPTLMLFGMPRDVIGIIGSEIRQPLGYAIVGGRLVSQVLTLFTTPVVYIYMDRLGHWLGRRHAAGAAMGIAVPEADAR
jgi:multidrug efflux pump subunit AcrB